jgi:FkbM family methyltransferase
MDEKTAGFRYREDLEAWWPDYDHKPEKCKQFVDHGLPAIDVAVQRCRGAEVAVQAGGHAGFWPKRLREIFRKVYTFEPEPILYECMVRNTASSEPGAGTVYFYPLGLGAEVGRARFKSHVSAGSWRVDPAGEYEIELTTVDSLELPACDAIFLDIEGYEAKALIGARKTVARYKPVILCELLPRSAEAIEAWMHVNGYKQVARFGRDGIYTFGGR